MLNFHIYLIWFWTYFEEMSTRGGELGCRICFESEEEECTMEKIIVNQILYSNATNKTWLIRTVFLATYKLREFHVPFLSQSFRCGCASNHFCLPTAKFYAFFFFSICQPAYDFSATELYMNTSFSFLGVGWFPTVPDKCFCHCQTYLVHNEVH